MHNKLTIQDIARLAGVSKATVSRVLNHNSSVNAELRERVQAVIQEHDFVPSITAIGLAGGRTRLIGVLAPPLTWPAVPEIMRGVAEYIESTDYEMVLYSISNERNHADVLDRILAMRMIAGLLAIHPGELAHHLTTRFHQGLPLVMIDDQSKHGNVPWVGIDNRASAYEASQYLLECGHKRIAHIMGPQNYYCAIERAEGYKQALEDADIAPDPALLLQGNFTVESGRQCAEQLFSRARETWPSAVFVGNDQMAYGFLEVAEQRGVQLPQDIALVGFDDNLLSAHMKPPLTTIRQPFFEIGHNAIETLLTMVDLEHQAVQSSFQKASINSARQIAETTSNKVPQLQLPTRLIVRASSNTRYPSKISV